MLRRFGLTNKSSKKKKIMKINTEHLKLAVYVISESFLESRLRVLDFFFVCDLDARRVTVVSSSSRLRISAASHLRPFALQHLALVLIRRTRTNR